MPITLAGFVKRRRHQFGRQGVFGTAVSAVRAYPFKGVPSVDPGWTDPDVDVGSIDKVAAPFRGIGKFGASLTDPALRYNSLPLLLSGFFGGAVAATGGPAYDRLYAPASMTVDPVDTFTYEHGDDVATDWDQLWNGILKGFEVSAENKGAFSTTMDWLFGDAAGSGYTDFPASPSVPTALTVEPNEAIVYLKDTSLYIASDPYDLSYSGAKITDALHSIRLRFDKEVDEKRFANGDQSFGVDAWGIAGRSIEAELTFAKTPDIVGLGSESDAWYSEQAVDRYIRLVTESTEDAGVGVPYLWDQSMPLRYYTRTRGEIGGNDTIVLTGHAFFAPTHNIGTYSAEVTNTLADANL